MGGSEGSEGVETDGSAAPPGPPEAMPSCPSAMHATPPPKDSGFFAVCVFLVCLVVYGMTLNPTVPGGDSGELIYSCYLLGAAHPPGYPLFTLIGFLFTRLAPFGSVAYRVNLSCAVCGSAAAAVVHLGVARWTGSVWAGVVGAVWFAFSPLEWKYTVEAEVFPLNNLLCACLIYLTVTYAHDPSRDSVAYLGALVIGLGVCNQHTIIFYVAPLTLWVLVCGWRRLLHPKRFAVLVAAGLVGLTPYLHLVLAAHRAPLESWGDQRTVDGFLHHFLRREYGTFRLGNEGADDLYEQRLRLYMQTLWGDSWGALPVLGALGGLGALWRDGTGRVLVGTWALYTFVFNYLANLTLDPLKFFITARFWQQPNMIVCMVAALATERMCGIATRPLPSGSKDALTAAVALAVAMALIYHNYSINDESENWTFYNYGKSHIDALPRNAVILLNGDIISNSIRYLLRCEGYRPDVTTLNLSMMSYRWFWDTQRGNYPHINFPGTHYHPYEEGGFGIADFLASNSKYPLFISGSWQQGDLTHEGRYRRWTLGHVQEIRPEGRPLPFRTWMRKAANALPRYRKPALYKYPEGTWEDVVASDVHGAYHHLGYDILINAIGLAEAGPTEDVADMFRIAGRIFENQIPGMERRYKSAKSFYYKNAGIAYARINEVSRTETPEKMQKNYEKMLKYWHRLVSMDDPEDDPQMPAIRKMVADGIKRGWVPPQG